MDIMEIINKRKLSSYCIMCGAAPGWPCSYISTIEPDSEDVREGYEIPHNAGDARPYPHFYRGGLDHPPMVPVKDEQ